MRSMAARIVSRAVQGQGSGDDLDFHHLLLSVEKGIYLYFNADTSSAPKSFLCQLRIVGIASSSSTLDGRSAATAARTCRGATTAASIFSSAATLSRTFLSAFVRASSSLSRSHGLDSPRSGSR